MTGPTFGDGIARPLSSVLPYKHKTPTLEDVYPLALSAQRAGESFVFAEASAAGRPWAMSLTCFGVRAPVVRRIHEHLPGKPAERAPVATLVLRFAVIDVLMAYKRDYLKRTNTDSGKLLANRPRRMPRNVTIR